ncbi:hypothetical protein B9479_001837 [Cryptococcus floricola]|uniref:Methyltransferase domain-containing protein n=1 Tax=Cryptococcus floricola TaxID=2591691 RepID=A0A5D3B4H1_9TREE|nr:hypothetical protein B9479_001837 [Cryptococcus floricola]
MSAPSYVSAASQPIANLAKQYTVHDIAKTGFGEGTNDLYNAARPSYPADALEIIHDTLAPTPRALKIIEPGSGTGIFSRLLLRAPSPEYPAFDIDTLVGVEPSEGMRNSWWRALEKEGLGKRQELEGGQAVEARKAGAVDGGFDALGKVKEYGLTSVQEGGGVDGREIASFLPPGAPLILIWNLESQSPNWQGLLRETYEAFDLDSPQYYKGLWRKMFENPAYGELFEAQEEKQVGWSAEITEQGLMNRLLSKSYLTEQYLKGAEREELVDSLRRIIHEGDKDWVDQENGVFRYNYNTDVVICRRRA